MTLDDPPFSKDQCDRLFAAVLVHDEIHLNATLPDFIHLNYNQDELSQCYRICRQLWKQGVDNIVLSNLIRKLISDRSFSQEDKTLYHNIRAKIKHVRFAYITCDQRHTYPIKFHKMTIIMGRLQDAFKNHKRFSVIFLALIVRLCLTSILYRLITKELDDFKASTPESYRNYIMAEINLIEKHLANDKVTSKEFHEIRKVVSRQVALYDNLKTLYPSNYHSSISQYLSTINGLMGSMHDKLISEKLSKTQDYYNDTFELPAEIRLRLTALVEKYRTPPN